MINEKFRRVSSQLGQSGVNKSDGLERHKIGCEHLRVRRRTK